MFDLIFNFVCLTVFSERLIHEVRQKIRSIEGEWCVLLCAAAWSRFIFGGGGSLGRVTLTLYSCHRCWQEKQAKCVSVLIQSSNKDETITRPWFRCSPGFSSNTSAEIVKFTADSTVQVILLMSDVRSVNTSFTCVCLHCDAGRFCLQTSVSPVEVWTWAWSTHCLLGGCARAVRYAAI